MRRIKIQITYKSVQERKLLARELETNSVITLIEREIRKVISTKFKKKLSVNKVLSARCLLTDDDD